MPCVNPVVLVSMLEQEKANPHKGKLISVSMLTGGCKRKTFLERTLDYYLTPDEKLPTFRGTMVHAIVEKSNKKKLKDCLVEEHMELPVKTESGEWTLSGTLDFYDPRRQTIFDIKTLAPYAVGKLVKGEENGTWSKHISDAYVKQLNLYSYLLRKVKGLPVKHLRLQIIDFSRLILTGTRVEFGDWKNKQKYDVPDIPILPDDLIEEWIQKEGDAWYKILYMNGPTQVVDEKYKWLCKKCPFNKTEHCPNPELERAQTFDV